MNHIKIDFPERLQANAFAVWMENEGFDLFKSYYGEKMPEERQPKNSEVQFDDSEGKIEHFITID